MPFCECGCGAKVNNRYVHNHQGRRAPFDYLVQDMGYKTPCWVWQLGQNKWGYAKIKRGGITMSGHKYFYEIHKGRVPDGLILDHLCRVRHCVNPDHLEPVTYTTNTRRGTGTKLTEEQVRSIPDLYMAGNSLAAIGRILNVNGSWVGMILKGRMWSDVSVFTPARRERNLKLTMEKAEEIRKRVSSGELQKDVAKDYGICFSQVSAIVRGDCWARKER